MLRSAIDRHILRRDRLYLLAVVLLALVHHANGCVVISRDTAPMVSDALDHYRWAADVATRARAGDIGGAAQQLWGYYQRPPLGMLPTVAVLAVVADESHDPFWARASMLLWLWPLMLATFAIGRRLHSPAAGVLACAFLGAMPMVLGFSRLLWLDLPLAAMTAALVDALLRTEHLSRRGASLWLGVVAGVGLLVKQALPIFALPLGIWYVAAALRRGRGCRPLLNLAAAAGLAAALFATWAVVHGAALVKSAQMASVERTEQGYQLGHYIAALPQTALGLPIAVALAAALVVLIKQGRLEVLALVGFWLPGSLALLSFFVPWDRYMLPSLPAAALACGAATAAVAARAGRARGALALACLILLGLGLQQSWVGPPHHRCEAHRALGRTACAGLVRASEVPHPRLDLSSLQQGPRTGRVAVLPWVIERAAADATPYDEVGELVQYQLLLSGKTRLKAEAEWKFEHAIPRVFQGFRYIFLVGAAPGDSAREALTNADQARQWLGQRRGTRWSKLSTLSLPGGEPVEVYANSAPSDLSALFQGSW